MTTAEFRTVVDAQTEKPREDDLAGIVDQLKERIGEVTAKARDIGLNAEECDSLRERLVAAAEYRWMMTRYASIDLSFAQRSLSYLVGRDESRPDQVVMRGLVSDDYVPKKTETVVQLPEYVTVWDDLRDWQSRYSEATGWNARESVYSANQRSGYDLPPVRVGGVHYSRTRVYVTTKYPDGITSEMFDRMRKAKAFSRMFGVYLLDRGIEGRLERERDEFGLLWCPSPDRWVASKEPPRVEGDPAILFRSGGRVYLVGYFDTPDERSLDAMIREFSQGDLPRKGRK